MTSGPSTSSTRDAAIDGTSDGEASTLLRRAMIAIHPRISLWRRIPNIPVKLGAARVPVNRLRLPHRSGSLLGPARLFLRHDDKLADHRWLVVAAHDREGAGL